MVTQHSPGKLDAAMCMPVRLGAVGALHKSMGTRRAKGM
jgi:hypothetical protein